jgi:hypothetical protein
MKGFSGMFDKYAPFQVLDARIYEAIPNVCNNAVIIFGRVKSFFCVCFLYVQSTAHQTLHFVLCNALVSRALALISNCKCKV